MGSHPLHYQSSLEQQQQQQNSQYTQPQNQMMMQGSPQISSSPLMNQNNYMQQQQQQHHQNQLTHQVSSHQGHQYLAQPQHQHQQHQLPNNPMQHNVPPQGQYQQQQYQQQQYQQQQQQQHAQRPTFHRAQSMQHPSTYNDTTGVVTSSTATSTPVINGPRAKCDQVIYEAIAKACEIAVRGRCMDDGMMGAAGHGVAPKRRSWNYGGSTNAQSSSTNNSSSTTSSRFNLEVDEVPCVRSIVQTWKRAPHVPLRLDIYYEHDGCYDHQEQTTDSCDGQQARPPTPQPQRELLERWCIDYVPSSSSNTNNSTSPYSSPSSSPYSSRIMTGATVNSLSENKSSSNSGLSNISQLRQVCKRIVVLLRSLHCLTRMLPSYRLKCLLQSNIANGGSGVTMNGLPGMAGLAAGGNTNSSRMGWGSIGFSIHTVSDYEHEPSLPSPSFARQAFPSVPTPYGNLRLSVMYDATLNPNHMVADLVERRTEWMQRRWTSAGGAGGQHPHEQPQYQYTMEQQYQYQQQLYQQQLYMEQQSHPMPNTMPTSTQPIPISPQVHQYHHARNAAVVSTSTAMIEPREYGSCPPTALMGGPASFGSTGHRSRAVSDFIISDYHHSPNIKSLSHSPSQHVATATGGFYRSGNDGEQHQQQRVMSGLSLAMMNDQANPSIPVEPHMMNQNTHQYASPNNEYGQYPQQQQQQHEEDMILPSFGSPATRAAFHNPPPLYSNSDVDIQQGKLSGMAYDTNENQHHGGGGTHFFHKHAGYGYGYNGSNVHFGEEQEVNAPPPPLSPSPPVVCERSAGTSGGSMSSCPLTSTPPTPHQQGVLWPDNKNGRSKSPLVTRNNSDDHAHVDAPKNVNPTTFQPPPSPGTTTHRSGTPPTSVLASRHHYDHPNSPGGAALDNSKSNQQQQQRSNRRPSSQSVQLLPPVTSLDILQKSPFLAAGRKTTTTEAAGEEEGGANNNHRGGVGVDDNGLCVMPFILGSYRDDMFTSSIPRMVSDERNGNSIAVSTLGGGGGGGSSNHPFGGGLSSYANNSNSSVHRGSMGSTSHHHRHFVVPEQTEAEELPFEVDDDNLLVRSGGAALSSSNNSPSKSGGGSRSLWGSTKADNVLDGTLGGDVAEIASSLAVSSLHHRCAADGKVRLKMFESSTRMVESAGVGVGGSGEGDLNLTTMTTANNGGGGDPRSDFASIKDQLSDFRSFGASLMISSSTQESQSN
mmetsp:Transcript_8117/g.14679  ORF Transcript_8117/g.14679 Transcript_8117/m.14679 type:complete len:1209 (+) Transcript_8117:518-4144(+)